MKTITIKGKRVPAPWREAYSDWGKIISDSDGQFEYKTGLGGHLICVDVHSAYQPLIIAAPDLFTRLKNLVSDVSSGSLDSESLHEAATLIFDLEKTP